MTVHDNNVNDRSDTTVHYWKYLDDQYQDYSRLSTERKTRPGYVCISKLKPSDVSLASALKNCDAVNIFLDNSAQCSPKNRLKFRDRQ